MGKGGYPADSDEEHSSSVAEHVGVFQRVHQGVVSADRDKDGRVIGPAHANRGEMDNLQGDQRLIDCRSPENQGQLKNEHCNCPPIIALISF
jgi:hypothetical protein